MKRSVYSLVLDDEVVAAIDVCAVGAGMNRSAYINQLLARHVGYVTPDEQIEQFLDALSAYFGGIFQVMPVQGKRTLTMIGAIRYAYSPKIRYQVILSKDWHEATLKISSRTRNVSLLVEIVYFLEQWARLEAKYIPNGPFGQGKYEIISPCTMNVVLDTENGDFTAEAERMIERFHNLLQVYFVACEQGKVSEAMLEEAYCQQDCSG